MNNVSVIGIGKWGKNYIKNLSEMANLNLKYVSSLSKSTYDNLDDSLKLCEWTNNYKNAINDQIDTVIIATHPNSHFEISKYALERGKNVICEKPCMFNHPQYEDIYELVAKNKNLFYTNYINLFNPTLNQVKKAVKNDFNYFTITNAGQGPFRKDYSGLWDYGCHVMSVLFYVFNSKDLKLHTFSLDEKKNYSMLFSYNLNKIYANFGNNYDKRINNFNLSMNDSQIYWEDPRDGKPLNIMLNKYLNKELESNLNLSFRIGSILKSLKDDF